MQEPKRKIFFLLDVNSTSIQHSTSCAVRRENNKLDDNMGKSVLVYIDVERQSNGDNILFEQVQRNSKQWTFSSLFRDSFFPNIPSVSCPRCQYQNAVHIDSLNVFKCIQDKIHFIPRCMNLKHL